MLKNKSDSKTKIPLNKLNLIIIEKKLQNRIQI